MSGVERIVNEMSVETPTSQLVLEKQFVRNSKNDLTISVENIKKLVMRNTVAVTVTRFLRGQDGQEISILGDGFTTIEHNAFIKTTTGADQLLLAEKVYRFTLIEGVFYEDA